LRDLVYHDLTLLLVGKFPWKRTIWHSSNNVLLQF